MKGIFTKCGLLICSVVVMLMASTLIIIVHLAKLIRKFNLIQNSANESHS